MRLDPKSLEVSVFGKNRKGRRVYDVKQRKRLLIRGTRAEVYRYLKDRMSKRDQRETFARVA